MPRRRLSVEHLEDRTAPAAFAEAGAILTLDLNVASETVAVVSNGATYSLTLAGGTWAGTDSANVTGNGTAALTVTAAGLAAFTTGVRITDSAVGTAVAFNDSGTNAYANPFDLVLDGGSTGVAFNGASSFGAFALGVSTDRTIALNTGASVTTTSGAVSLTANKAGTATGNFSGITVNGATLSSSTGAITLDGRGGKTGTTNRGVFITGGGEVRSTGTGSGVGAIAVTGKGGRGTNQNYGIEVTGAGSLLTSAGGSVSVTGTGTGTGVENTGVRVADGGQISAGGTGSVTVTGTGGATTTGSNNYGVEVAGTGATVTSGGGAVSIDGTGGNGSNGTNYGVFLQFGGVVTSGGTGGTTVVGRGGTGSGNLNAGVFVIDSGSTITSGGGAVTVTGTGGGSGAGFQNYGVHVEDNGTITAGALGAVTVTGTGGASGGGFDYGVEVTEEGAVITSGGGPVTVTGQGGGVGSAPNNYGVFLQFGGVISSGGMGEVKIDGTGGTTTGAENYGVFVTDTGSTITSGGGAVSVTGTGVNAADIRVFNAALAAGTGDLALTADTLALDGITSVNGIGTLSVRPRTPEATIGLGGGAGTLNLTDIELAALQDGFAAITIGAVGGTGAVTVNTATFLDPVTFVGGTVSDANDASTDVIAPGATFTGPVSPGGTSPGTFSVAGGLTLTAGASLTIQISGLTPGTGYDQVTVTGAVSLGGSALAASAPFATTLGDTFTIIDNDGADPVVGTLEGLPEGADLMVSGRLFRVTYAGGSGNDVVLTRINASPVAGPDSLTTGEDEAGTIDPRGNDTDLDGDALTVTAVTQGANGTVTFTPTGVTYGPAANYNGPDSFTYTVSDGNGGTATATVTVTVTAANDPPTATDDTLILGTGAQATVVDVLANDSSVPDAGEVLTVTAVTQPAHGTVSLTGGVVRYKPAAGYTGPDSFTYTVSDGNGGFATPTVAVTVVPVGGLSPLLAVGGSSNGAALVFAPSAAGQYNTAPVATLAPFDGFAGQVRTATGDVDGDGSADTILVTGPGTPIRVAVVSGADNATVLVAPFDPFSGDFTGGGFVAAGDIDGDGKAEFIVTPDQGGGPRVSIFSLANGSQSLRANFFGIDDPNFRGGARAAVGDVNGDGVPDLAVAAGFLGGPRVALFNGTTLLGTPTRLISDFFAFPGSDAETLRNGVFVASGDMDGDGKAELIFGGGPGGAPRVFILSGAKIAAGDVAGAQTAPVGNFFVAGNADDRSGVRLAVKDADADGKADVVAGSGEGAPSKVRVYLGKNFTGDTEPSAFQDIDPFGTTLPGGVFVG